MMKNVRERSLKRPKVRREGGWGIGAGEGRYVPRRAAAAYQNLVGRHMVKEGQMGLKSERYRGGDPGRGEEALRCNVNVLKCLFSLLLHSSYSIVATGRIGVAPSVLSSIGAGYPPPRRLLLRLPHSPRFSSSLPLALRPSVDWPLAVPAAACPVSSAAAVAAAAAPTARATASARIGLAALMNCRSQFHRTGAADAAPKPAGTGRGPGGLAGRAGPAMGGRAATPKLRDRRVAAAPPPVDILATRTLGLTAHIAATAYPSLLRKRGEKQV